MLRVQAGVPSEKVKFSNVESRGTTKSLMGTFILGPPGPPKENEKTLSAVIWSQGIATGFVPIEVAPR